ncbi:MAG TPA: polyhydroxyalkanoic acid system family protein [Candidatus Kapabacteria bacterium]|jgi:putative polyhydroxyalkanoate system protein|nr:polyhydroxyalkanoic acid system family protein [Candidatus Kapabacteria bacterium]
MATIDIVRTHSLGRAGARKAVDDMAADIASRLQADTTWQGDTLSFKRSGANGRIDVEEKKVRINIELGMLLSPMRGMIEQQINSYLDEHFGG